MSSLSDSSHSPEQQAKKNKFGTSDGPAARSTGSRSNKISSMPSEILSLIFSYTYEKHYRSRAYVENVWNTTACEITLSHVCSVWRTNTLALPQLWNTFRYIKKDSGHANTHMERLSAYLDRSGTQPLDIWLDLRSGSAVDHRPVLLSDRDLLQTVIEQQGRWRRFTLLVNNMESAAEYETLLADVHAPHLEHFTFCAMPIYCLRKRGSCRVIRGQVRLTLHSTEYTLLKAAAPMLQSVRLDSSTFVSNTLSRHVYSNLHTLRIDDNSDAMTRSPSVRLHKLTEVLKIPCLRNLSISNMTIEDLPHNIDGPLFTMKNLKDFRCCSPTIVKLLQHIDTPALESMVLKRVRLPILRETSVSSLESIVLIACDKIPESYFTIGIERLSVFDARHFAQQISHSFSNYTRDLWPNLTYLGYHIHISENETLAILTNFVQKRAPKPLTVEIPSSLLDHWEDKEPQSLASLRAMCILQRWEDGRPLIPLHWPYKEDDDIFGHDLNDHDPFRLLWHDQTYVGLLSDN